MSQMRNRGTRRLCRMTLCDGAQLKRRKQGPCSCVRLHSRFQRPDLAALGLLAAGRTARRTLRIHRTRRHHPSHRRRTSMTWPRPIAWFWRD